MNLKQDCPSSVMNYIHDDLLMNILIRLPYKSADIARFVSKHWYVFISRPKFGIEYIRYKRNNNNGNGNDDDEEEKQAPWTFLAMLGNPRFDVLHEYFQASPEEVNKSPNFTKLDFLPDDNNKKKIIASIFSDLILCFSVDESSMERSYFICNPLSKQWVALPSYPFKSLTRKSSKPFLIFDNDISRFRVVVVHHPFAHYDLAAQGAGDYDPNLATFFRSLVFCSESWEWKQVNLIVPTLQPGNSYMHGCFQGVVCERLLCLFHDQKFGAFDPFDVVSDTPSSITAKFLLPIRKIHQNHILMECAKKLITVWTRENRRVGGCGWVMQRLEENTNTDSNDDGPLVWKVVSTGVSKFKFEVIGVDPMNHNLLHVLLNHGKVAMFDLMSRHLEPIGITNKSPHSRHLPFFHRLELQRWPTPIPTLD